MLDLKAIRENPEPVRSALALRHPSLPEQLDRLLALDEEWRAATTRVEELRAEKNRVSKETGKASKEDRPALIDRGREIGAQLEELEPRLGTLEDELREMQLRMPNPPHPSVPVGTSDDDNELVREVGSPPSFGFEPRDHVDLGTALGIIDLERAARLSGARFTYLVGAAAWVQFALVRFCFDTLAEKGFTPHGVHS